MTGLGPLYALLTVASTLVGGLVGIRLRHRLTGVMAFPGYPIFSSRATTRDIMDQVVADYATAQSPISPAIQRRIN